MVPVGTNAAQNLERLSYPFSKKEDPVILIQGTVHPPHHNSQIKHVFGRRDYLKMQNKTQILNKHTYFCKSITFFLETKKIFILFMLNSIYNYVTEL